jgi:uncharacterized repeat protein (TIGR03803 family)
MRQLCRLLLILTIGASWAACTRSAGPVIPQAGGTSQLERALHPHAFHIVPFFDFRGGKLGERPVAGLIAGHHSERFGVMAAGGGGGCAATATLPAGCGVIYELALHSGSYVERVVYRFRDAGGVRPLAPLAGNGSGDLVFGTTSAGGAYGFGTVYELNIGTGAVSTIYSFKGGSDGATPIGQLYVDASGDLFGTTAFGGGGGCTGGCGTAFELTPSASAFSERVIATFKGGNDGWEPWTGLIARNGELFGTTLYGGNGQCTSGCGTIFRLVAGGSGYSRHLIHAIDGATEGAYIKSPLFMDADGNLFVEAQNGGDSACVTNGGVKGALGCGVLLELVQHGGGTYTTTIVHTFAGGSDGALPVGGVTSSGGTLYGTTAFGGGNGKCGRAAAGCGVAFSVAAGTYQVFHRFQPASNGGVLDAKLFLSTKGVEGMTRAGGTYGDGAIFRLTGTP